MTTVGSDNKRLRVLQLNKLYHPWIGGVETVAQDIAEGLNDTVDMTVLVCQPKGRASEERINGVRVLKAGSLGMFFSMPVSISYLFRARRLARQADIMQIHTPFPIGDLACLLSGFKGKVVVWWHFDVTRQKKLMLIYRPILHRLLKRADLIIAATPRHIDQSQDLKPYADKCRIIPYGIRIDDYLGHLSEVTLDELARLADAYAKAEQGKSAHPIREHLQPDHTVTEHQQRTHITPEHQQRNHPASGHPQPKYPVQKQAKAVKLLFAGRLVYYKGVDVLIRAFSKVHGAELYIAGTGVLENDMRKMCADRGKLEKVHFLGQLSDSDLKSAFRDCDIFVFPSVVNTEAFGIVQLEAMVYGKPVINTSLPTGVPTVSLHGVTGLTVSPGDEEALATAVQRLVDNPELVKEYGENARRRVRDVYDLKITLQALMTEYRRALANDG